MKVLWKGGGEDGGSDCWRVLVFKRRPICFFHYKMSEVQAKHSALVPGAVDSVFFGHPFAFGGDYLF